MLPFTWLLLRVTVPSRFWMPPPPALGGGVVVHLAVVEGQEAGGAGEVHVVAVGDTAADKAHGGVVVHLAAVERDGAEHVHDAAAAQAVLAFGRRIGRVWLLSVTVLLLSVSLATLVGSKVALAMPPPAVSGCCRSPGCGSR